MFIKCFQKRNLKMSTNKLASQVGHVTANITAITGEIPTTVIVLDISATQFDEMKKEATFIQIDRGLTEVSPGTETCYGIAVYD